MAHDLKNPLAALKGAAQVLLDVAREDPQRAAHQSYGAVGVGAGTAAADQRLNVDETERYPGLATIRDWVALSARFSRTSRRFVPGDDDCGKYGASAHSESGLYFGRLNS